MNTKKQHRLFSLSALIISALILSACGASTQTTKSISTGGYGEHALHSLESQHKNSPDNVKTALKYTKALRQADYLNRASTVIAPFANDEDGDINAKLEYAAIQLSLGNYAAAEDYASYAVTQEPDNPSAHHFLGMALDSREDQKAAEQSFRKAIELWDTPPTSALNDLALNLASQGQFEEAIEILEANLSSVSSAVRRNLRIVQTMQEGSPEQLKKKLQNTPPKPKHKPQT